MSDIKKAIRTVPNWPVEGVMFRDITTLLQDPAVFKEVIDCFHDRYKRPKAYSRLGHPGLTCRYRGYKGSGRNT